MSGLSSPAPITPLLPVEGDPGAGGYIAGACNIGPWEIRRRRAFAVVAFVAAAVLFAILVATGAPAWTRLIVFFPLMGGAFSWLQARRHFCAAYAWRGIANFTDDLTGARSVQDAEARRLDMAAVARMGRDSALIAAPITLLLALLPL